MQNLCRDCMDALAVHYSHNIICYTYLIIKTVRQQDKLYDSALTHALTIH